MPRYRFCPQCAGPLSPVRDAEGRDRLSCGAEGCGFVHYENPTPVVAAIVEHEGDVVLGRNAAWPGKFFGLITGFLEKGEEPAEAVIREVREELGLEGEIAEFVGIYTFYEMNQVILAWHVRARGEIVLNEEIAEIKRVPPEKLRPWPMGTGKAVADWLARRG